VEQQGNAWLHIVWVKSGGKPLAKGNRELIKRWVLGQAYCPVANDLLIPHAELDKGRPDKEEAGFSAWHDWQDCVFWGPRVVGWHGEDFAGGNVRQQGRGRFVKLVSIQRYDSMV
jgi:hypothetical protein